MRRVSVLSAFLFVALFAGWSNSQNPPAKDDKQPPPKAAAEDNTALKEDLKLLRDNGVKVEAADLLQFFRKRTYKQPDPKQLTSLLAQLGDNDYAMREKAYAMLRDMGTSAMPAIKQGEHDADLEVRKRVGELKRLIDNKVEPLLQAAAARVLAREKPAGTVEVLIDFLPFATEPAVVDELGRTLGAVAVRNGTTAPTLVKTLGDSLPVKRGIAGEALLRGQAKEQIPAVKALLKDKDASVRLRVALAMLPLQDKEVVPVLIDLMGELSPNELWPVEEVLVRLAGEKAPSVSLGNNDADKKACRDAWQKWLADNDKTIDMTKLTNNAYLGYTLIVQQNNRIGPGGGNGTTGEICELDKDFKTRWKFDVPTFPVDAQMVGANRVLVAERNASRVTEREIPRGEVKWEYNCGAPPFAVQRLASGNTFIAMQNRLVEVDRNKKEVWNFPRPQGDLMRAKKLPDGDVVFVTNLGINAMCTRIDGRTQQIKKSFQVMGVQILFGSIDVLPNGNIIIPHYQRNLVIEYDPDGKQVKTFNLQWPNSVMRLPNGNTLVTSYQARQVVELGAAGDRRNAYQADFFVYVARRR